MKVCVANSLTGRGTEQNMTIPDSNTHHRIVYFSQAKPNLDREAVDDLVRNARVKNRKLGITGALLYEKGYFLQVLEGPRKDVRELFRAIQVDDRHEKVHLLIEDDLEHRRFSGWNLAWNRGTDEALSEHLEGLKESLTHRRSTAADLPSIHKFLIIFHSLIPEKNSGDQEGTPRESATTAHYEDVTLLN